MFKIILKGLLFSVFGSSIIFCMEGDNNDISSFDVAKYIMQKMETEDKIFLQKALYFCKKVYAERTKDSLFKERVLAWYYGPAEPILHDTCSIGEKNTYKIEQGNSEKLSNLGKETIDLVISQLKEFNSQDLIEISHLDPAWINAWYLSDKRNSRNNFRSEEVISLESMKQVPLELLIEGYNAIKICQEIGMHLKKSDTTKASISANDLKNMGKKLSEIFYVNGLEALKKQDADLARTYFYNIDKMGYYFDQKVLYKKNISISESDLPEGLRKMGVSEVPPRRNDQEMLMIDASKENEEKVVFYYNEASKYLKLFSDKGDKLYYTYYEMNVIEAFKLGSLYATDILRSKYAKDKKMKEFFDARWYYNRSYLIDNEYDQKITGFSFLRKEQERIKNRQLFMRKLDITKWIFDEKKKSDRDDIYDVNITTRTNSSEEFTDHEGNEDRVLIIRRNMSDSSKYLESELYKSTQKSLNNFNKIKPKNN